jgi:hypothetical protein
LRHFVLGLQDVLQLHRQGHVSIYFDAALHECAYGAQLAIHDGKNVF